MLMVRLPLPLLLLASLVAGPALASDLPAPTYRGEIVLPTGLSIAGIEFGGISGLDYDAASGHFFAISDDRSEKAPARVYELAMTLSQTGITGLDITATHTLTGLDGKPFAPKSIDPEAVRVDAAHGHIFWSSEGDADGKPAIYIADSSEKAVALFELPRAYMPNKEGTRGIQPKLAFEGLAISPDGKFLYASTENALIQDGPKADFDHGSRSRILKLDIGTGKPVGEYLYTTEPIPQRPASGSADNGISEILPLDENRLLVVERSYMAGIGNHIAIFVADLAGATDFNGAETIPQDAQPVKKRLWFKLDEGDDGLDVDNIEAMSWGPDIDGERSLVMGSDNNFSTHQFTQFVLFTVPKG